MENEFLNERQGSGAAGDGLRINQQGSSRRCQHPLVQESNYHEN
jgi:hypothetical protein